MITDKEVDDLLNRYIEDCFYFESLNFITNKAGIYLFLKKNDEEIIYVGKSKNVKNRITIHHSVCKKLLNLNTEFRIKVYVINKQYLSLDMAESLVLNHLMYNLSFFPIYNNEV